MEVDHGNSTRLDWRAAGALAPAARLGIAWPYWSPGVCRDAQRDAAHYTASSGAAYRSRPRAFACASRGPCSWRGLCCYIGRHEKSPDFLKITSPPADGSELRHRGQWRGRARPPAEEAL